MEYKRLDEIAQITMGQSPDSTSYNDEKDGIPFFQGNADFGEKYPTARLWCNNPKKIAEAGDILISVRAPIGALNYAKEKCCIGRGLAALHIDDEITRDYIYRFLKSKNNELNFKGTGSTFKAISKTVLEELQVPILSKAEKLNCINLFDQLEKILNYRQQQLDFCDTLTKARFVEMFGDPSINNKSWEVVKIKDIVQDVRYGTSRPAIDGGNYKYLRMNNLTANGELDLSDLKYIDVPDEEIEDCIVRKGDVLFNRTNSIDLVGKTSLFILQEPMIIAGYIIRVRLKEFISPTFFVQFMNSEFMKLKLRHMAKGAVNQANINAKELQNIDIYVPPVEKQREFEQTMGSTTKSKFAKSTEVFLVRNPHIVLVHHGVMHGRVNLLVPQQLLYLFYGHPLVNSPGSHGAPEFVRMNLFNVDTTAQLPQSDFYTADLQPVVRSIQGHK